MTTSIQQLPKDCLVQIFQYFPVEKREKLEEICKVFQKIVLDPYFEKERKSLLEIARVASHYPKELVNALGGSKALFELDVFEPPKKGDNFAYLREKIINPSRCSNDRQIIFQTEYNNENFLENVQITKNDLDKWIWKGGTYKGEWELQADDIDYVRRLFLGEPCGSKFCQKEGFRSQRGEIKMLLVKGITPLSKKTESTP